MPGLFRVYVGTMPDEADRVVAAIVEQVRAMHAGAFSDDEVDRARRYRGRLVGLRLPDRRAARRAAARARALRAGPDEPILWPDRVAAITPRQVPCAARLHLDPAALARVEFGPIRRRVANPQAECA